MYVILINDDYLRAIAISSEYLVCHYKSASLIYVIGLQFLLLYAIHVTFSFFYSQFILEMTKMSLSSTSLLPPGLQLHLVKTLLHKKF
jgi:hypothetical protein